MENLIPEHIFYLLATWIIEVLGLAFLTCSPRLCVIPNTSGRLVHILDVCTGLLMVEKCNVPNKPSLRTVSSLTAPEVQNKPIVLVTFSHAMCPTTFVNINIIKAPQE